jgi:SPP1 family predicted phage head-tail adaptor
LNRSAGSIRAKSFGLRFDRIPDTACTEALDLVANYLRQNGSIKTGKTLMGALFIDPGRLRSECALEACLPVADAMGGHTENWVEVATVFPLIEPVSAASRFGAGQTLETVTHRITMRHRSGVASGMRFTRQGRIFDIATVHDPDDTGRYLVCRVRETGA